MRDPAHRRSVAFLVLAALCWSLGGLLIKYIPWPPLAVGGARGLIAALFLVAVCRPPSLRPTRVQFVGACAYASCTLTFVAATKLTTAANAILLQYTAPVWVALFGAWLLKEPARRADWITIFFVLVGMVLFFADSLEVRNLVGNTIAVVSGLCFAAMTLALRGQKEGTPVVSIIWGNLLAFAIGLPAIVSAFLSAPRLTLSAWTALIVLGTVQLGVSYWLYSYAIRHVTALQAVLLPVIEPLLNPLWVLLAIGEAPSSWALAGGGLVLTAVTWRAWKDVR